MALANAHTDPNCPCGYCAAERAVLFGQKRHGGARPGAGRPALPDGEGRIHVGVRIAPATHAALVAAQREGESLSRTLDRIIAAWQADHA